MSLHVNGSFALETAADLWYCSQRLSLYVTIGALVCILDKLILYIPSMRHLILEVKQHYYTSQMILLHSFICTIVILITVSIHMTPVHRL